MKKNLNYTFGYIINKYNHKFIYKCKKSKLFSSNIIKHKIKFKHAKIQLNVTSENATSATYIHRYLPSVKTIHINLLIIFHFH